MNDKLKSLNINSITVPSDNTIAISLYCDDYNETSQIFKDADNLHEIEFNNQLFKEYTILKNITSFEDEGSINMIVVLEYNGLSKTVDTLTEKLTDANEQIDILTSCILEMADIIYA